VSTTAGHRLRLATEDDLGQICSIINHYIETSGFNFRTEPQTVDEWREAWAHLHERFPWLVATDDDRVLGVAYAAPWKERAAYQWTVEATIYVDSAAHRCGVGDALYTDLLRRLRSQGFRSVIAVIALPNDPSVRLHERHGFSQVAQLADAGFKLGDWHDVGLWQCVLRRGSEQPRAPTIVARS
jgi:phosphinothricin acetyltransferase